MNAGRREITVASDSSGKHPSLRCREKQVEKERANDSCLAELEGSVAEERAYGLDRWEI
jgi:hypothetical protein